MCVSVRGHLRFVPVRHPTHHWWAGAAVALLLAACAQASAAVPPTDVAGVHLERSDQVLSDVDPTASWFAPEMSGVPGAGAVTLVGATNAPVPTTAVAAPTVRPAGERTVTMLVGGVDRRWMLVVPPNTTERQRLPLLIVLHGVGGKGPAMQRLGFDKLAAPAGYIVAYPDAFGGSWNDGRPGMEPLVGSPVDDIAFLRELISRSVAEAGADPTRVAIAGFSNGALMASRAACEMTDQLASVILVSGAGPRDMTQRCKPSRPLPIMVVFGTADTVVPYEGGQVANNGGKSRGQVAPVREMLDIWRGVNGCTNIESVPVAATSSIVIALRGTGCRADLVHFKVAGGGHDWVSNTWFDTTTEAWRFVSTHL